MLVVPIFDADLQGGRHRTNIPEFERMRLKCSISSQRYFLSHFYYPKVVPRRQRGSLFYELESKNT